MPITNREEVAVPHSHYVGVRQISILVDLIRIVRGDATFRREGELRDNVVDLIGSSCAGFLNLWNSHIRCYFLDFLAGFHSLCRLTWQVFSLLLIHHERCVDSPNLCSRVSSGCLRPLHHQLLGNEPAFIQCAALTLASLL